MSERSHAMNKENVLAYEIRSVIYIDVYHARGEKKGEREHRIN